MSFNELYIFVIELGKEAIRKKYSNRVLTVMSNVGTLLMLTTGIWLLRDILV